MNFSPLKYPNISQSFYDALNPALQIDSRNHPHLSWIENNGHSDRIHYKYWDGLQWSVIEESDLDFSDTNLIHSENSLLLEEDDPLIVFAKNRNSGSQICIFKAYDNSWIKKRFSTTYKIKWIGCSIYDEVQYDFSSSSSIGSSSSSSNSSSSSVDSSSSSSISLGNESSSSSSSEGTSSSSSSSLIVPSSSSSEDITSSSSTSSYLDGYIYVSTMDEDGNLRIYLYSENNLTILNTFNTDYSESAKIKHGLTGTNLHYVFEKNNEIYCGFVGIDGYSLKRNWIQLEDLENLIGWNCCADFVENTGILYFSWAEKSNPAYLKLKMVDSLGNQSNYGILEDKIITTETTEIEADDFLINLSKNIGIYKTNDFIYIFNIGAKNTRIQTNGFEINQEALIVNGNPFSLNPSQVLLKAKNDIEHLVFVNQNDIIYFRSVLDEFPISPMPDISLLNSQRFKTGDLVGSNDIFDYEEINCIWDNRIGDILKESLEKVVVTANETDDPLCDESSYSSSSVSSETSLSSDNTRCLLTWRIRYTCENGWSLYVVNSQECIEYNEDIIVDQWIETGRVDGDSISWEASRWFENYCITDLATSSSSSGFSSSESSINDACWVFHKNDYPTPLPTLPRDFVCAESSSSSSVSSASSEGYSVSSDSSISNSEDSLVSSDSSIS